MSPRISFEPIGVEIECDEDETILDAAFREGWNLVHGCREGQCTACKSFLLEGEVSHESHSPDALSEGEESQGYTLLCRALPDTDDVVVELLHVGDPDHLRLAHPIVEGRATVAAVEPLTGDMVRLRLTVEEPAGFAFTPGQYVDLHLPGTDGEERRSFSMANVADDDGPVTLDLVIRRYPGGRFSGLLEPGGAGALAPGDELAFTGPYGSMALYPGERPVLLVAGGSGIGPILALLAELAAAGATRPVRFFYGARTAADLPLLDEIAALGARLPDFAFVPVLSDADPAHPWDGATGFVHDAAAATVGAGELTAPLVCACGPPPMIEALTAVLTNRHGIPEGDIAFDKFTPSAAGNEA